MTKTEQLYEGKAKKVWATEDPDVVIVDYKDDATAFNGEKKGTIVGKGVVNNKMSNYLMQLLEKHGVPTHFIEELSDRETAVKKVKIVPLEVIIRNRAAGSICKRLGLEEGMDFVAPSIEFSYKDDELGDPLINAYHAISLQSELNLSTLNLNSVKQATAKLFLPTKSAPTPAVSGILKHTKNLIKTVSAEIWAA